VGGRAHDRLGGDIAAAPRPVFDDERLAEPLRQPLAHRARGDVESTPAGAPTIKRTGRVGKAWAQPLRGTAGSAAAPRARWRKFRRGSFILNLPSRHSITSSARKRTDGGDGEVERFRGPEIHHQFELRRLLDRNVRRLCALEDLAENDR